MNWAIFSLFCGLVWIVAGIMPVLQCHAESPRGFAGLAIGDSVAQVRTRLGGLREAGFWAGSECCNCGVYISLFADKVVPERDFADGMAGPFRRFVRDEPTGHVAEHTIGGPWSGPNTETYLPKHVRDDAGGLWDLCAAPYGVWRRQPRGDESRVIGMIFFKKKLCYMGFALGELVAPAITKIMTERKAPNMKLLRRTNNMPLGEGYELDGIVWLVMDRLPAHADWLYTGNALVIYDDKIMSEVMIEMFRKHSEDQKREKARHFGK